MPFEAEWLTRARLRKAATALVVLAQKSERWQEPEARRSIRRKAGGSLDEIVEVVSLLVETQLADIKGQSVALTKAGRNLAGSCAKGDMKPMGLTLIRGGYFHHQARRLLESGSINNNQELIVSKAYGRREAPQLVGILEWWTEVEVAPEILVPAFLVEELASIKALLPEEASPQDYLVERKTIGERAELYSYSLERSLTANPSAIAWVSRISDAFGYDIEDTSTKPVRRIEVKGHRGSETVFYLSAHEWKKALEFGKEYELQFWGDINLEVDTEVEYAAPRAANYPRSIVDLASELKKDGWKMTPTNYKVTRGVDPS
ncbi:MAG: DUF3883 domain-containing protein [Chloroflexi bacterium]|nr:DUF3883 domain-containing protein [Chloroflexota bacterium]